MRFFYELIWLASQAASGLRYQWLVTYVLIVLASGALLWDFLTHRLKLDRKTLVLLLPLAGVMVILFIGAFFQEKPSLALAPYIALGVCIILAAISV